MQNEAIARSCLGLVHVQGRKARLNVCAAPLAEIGLLNRTLNSLEERGIALIGELASMTRDDLENIPNFGEKTIEECCEVLDRLQIPHPNWKKRKAKRSSKAKKKPARKGGG